MGVGAADVPVRRLVRSQCVYVTVGTTRTAMKEIVLMTTLPLYSTRDSGFGGVLLLNDKWSSDKSPLL